MSRFTEAIIENHKLGANRGRPKADLPVDKILELSRQGYSCRAIAKELGKIGFTTSKDTVNRLIRDNTN